METCEELKSYCLIDSSVHIANFATDTWSVFPLITTIAVRNA